MALLTLALGALWVALVIPLSRSRHRKRLAAGAHWLLVLPLAALHRTLSSATPAMQQLRRRSSRWTSEVEHRSSSSALQAARDRRGAVSDESGRTSKSLPVIAPRAHISPAAQQGLADVFAELVAVFGFQRESVETQRAHLIRLWDAQTTGCGDEQLAAQQLHLTMFETFERWLDTSAGLMSLERRRAVVVIKYRASSHAQRLREMALYLCLWAEAGNVRFCPEILCFFFECARRHVPSTSHGIGPKQQATTRGIQVELKPGHASALGPFEPGAYLNLYIRPLWRYMFDAGFSGLSAKGVPMERPLAEHESRVNYDDWNETFWTPERIRQLVTTEGLPVIDLPSSERWAGLARADWAASLRACKRHNEVHSWHCLFASFARIVVFHVAIFYLLLLLAHGVYDQRPEGAGWLESDNGVAIETGLLLPGVVQLLSELAKVRVQPSATVLLTLFAFDRALPYLVHIGLFVGLLYARTNPYMRMLFYAFSALVIVRATFFPRAFRRGNVAFDTHVFEPRGTLLPMLLFWLAAFFFKTSIETTVLMRALVEASERLEALRPLAPFVRDRLFLQFFTSSALLTRALMQLAVYTASFMSHISSTYIWIVLTICAVGTARGLYILHLSSGVCSVGRAATSVYPAQAHQLPAAFVSQVFALDPVANGVPCDGTHFVYPTLHPQLEVQWAKIWNAICASMYESDIVATHELLAIVYTGEGVDQSGRPFARPQIFEPPTSSRFCQQRGERAKLPDSPEFRRRFHFLWQSLKIDMPRPAPVEGIAAFSVLVPHYGETIITPEAELFARVSGPNAMLGTSRPEPLIALLMEYFPLELKRFRGRVGNRAWRVMWNLAGGRLAARGEHLAALSARRESESANMPVPGLGGTRTSRAAVESKGMSASAASDESKETPPPAALAQPADSLWPPLPDGEEAMTQAEALMHMRKWASMRTQTLYRTVRGMMYYEQALDLLLSVQRPKLSREQRKAIVSSKFQCIVTMQRYFHFDAQMNEAAEELLAEFPSLLIAAISEKRDPLAHGGVTYYSCLIDSTCAKGADGRRVPKTSVELPGCPILGDGKGDNQNTALPFVHGRLVQTIDANQEGYLEEALKICNALAEFGTDPSGRRESVTIVGFREHIYSALGTVAEFAASSEFVFGTMVQRVMDRPLLSRQYCTRRRPELRAARVPHLALVIKLARCAFPRSCRSHRPPPRCRVCACPSWPRVQTAIRTSWRRCGWWRRAGSRRRPRAST
jgi:1,3-beta-glucan synthase